MKKKLCIIGIVILIILVIINSILYHEQKIPVLGYHSFYKDKNELREDNPEFINDINKFEEQMKYLKKHKYKTLTMDEFYCWKQGKCKQPRKSVVITIDDGNLSNYMYAFPILKKYNFNATVFFVGSQAKDLGVEEGTIYDIMSLDLIEKCKKEYPNIEFYSHSFNLHGKPANEWTNEEQAEDIKQMKTIGDFDIYAYPFGVYDDNMINNLKQNGYKMAFGFGPRKDYRKARKSDDIYKVPRLNISNYVSMFKFIARLTIPY
jgi:peptidoglycan/xylan/chitin deacetylase (PgdA/CDA1 family)